MTKEGAEDLKTQLNMRCLIKIILILRLKQVIIAISVENVEDI